MPTETEADAPLDAIPPAVRAALQRELAIALPQPQWRIEPLAPGRPVYRVRIGGAAHVVKQSDHPARVAAVASVFAARGIAAVKVRRLIDDWLCLDDLALPTVEQRLSRGIRVDDLKDWMPGLGAAAAQADLVGMRDRNLRNLLVIDGGRFIHIDYEGGFSAGMFDRLARPGRYARYLLRRLFFDVIDAAGAADPAAKDEMFDRFAGGLAEEQRRLSPHGADGSAGAIGWKERLYLRSRMRDTPRTRRLFRRAFEAQRLGSAGTPAEPHDER